MAIETAVREPGGLHDLRYADAVEATLAKQARRGGQDPVSILLHLLATDLHNDIPFSDLDNDDIRHHYIHDAYHE